MAPAQTWPMLAAAATLALALVGCGSDDRSPSDDDAIEDVGPREFCKFIFEDTHGIQTIADHDIEFADNLGMGGSDPVLQLGQLFGVAVNNSELSTPEMVYSLYGISSRDDARQQARDNVEALAEECEGFDVAVSEETLVRTQDEAATLAESTYDKYGR